jgi:O-antigen ligase
MQHAALHNPAAYSMQYGITAAPPKGGLLTYLRAGTLSVWMFTLVFRFWWLSSWFAVMEQIEAGVDARAYYYIGFGLALAAHLTLGVAAWFALPFFVTSTWSGRIFTLFCVLEFLLAPLSQVPRASMIYAAATWGVYALFCLYWQSDYRIVRRMTVFAGAVVLAWLFLLLFKHGLTLGLGGAIGGINRNTTATAAVGAMICCLLSPNKKVFWAAMAAGIFMAVVVSSRGSMVALAAFFAVYYTISKGTVKAGVYAFGVGAIFGIALLASPQLQEIVFERILAIHSKARGIGSGLTGRVSMWQQGLESFWERPVLGWGLRSTTYGGGHGGVHSGYIKILIETGFVGTIIMLTAMLVELARRVRLGITFRKLSPAAAPGIDVEATARINAVAAGAIAMTMVVWVYEQLYINLGSTASLVFFLMMAAPAYITTQGVTLRR